MRSLYAMCSEYVHVGYNGLTFVQKLLRRKYGNHIRWRPKLFYWNKSFPLLTQQIKKTSKKMEGGVWPRHLAHSWLVRSLWQVAQLKLLHVRECSNGLETIRVSVRQSQFSALFSYILGHIELKFCMSLSSYEHSIKFECRQFPSIFVGVMPLFKLKILETHSFPQFSPTCYDILGWNFAYGFILLYYRSSSNVVNFRPYL